MIHSYPSIYQVGSTMIGALVAEISQDVETEHKQEIMQALYDHYWPQVKRGIISGMPEWYKSKLVTEMQNG